MLAADHQVVHFVRAVGQAQRARWCVHVGQRGVLRHAQRAVHLDRLVDDLAHALGHHRLDHVHPDAGFAVAQHVHRLGGLQHHQAHGLDLDAGARDDLDVAAQPGQFLPKASRDTPRLHHQVQRLLGLADRAHAVVDAARAEAHLRDLEAAAFAQQHVRLGHAHVVERMCMWPCGAWSSPNTCIGPIIFTPGVSMGTRICDCCLCGGASGLVRTM
jgi:hypothetical protein